MDGRDGLEEGQVGRGRTGQGRAKGGGTADYAVEPS